MSNFRKRTAEIVAAGEAKRGQWEPTGAPRRAYDYWLENSDSRKAEAIRWGNRKENFCHFWRVVAFWSPMLRMGKFMGRHDGWFFGVFAAAVVLVVLTLLGSLIADVGIVNFLLGALGFAGVVAVMGGLITGFVTLCEKFPKVMGTIGLGLLALAVLAFNAAIYTDTLVGGGIVSFLILSVLVVFWKFDAIDAYFVGRAELKREQREAEWRERIESGEPVEYREPGKVAKFFKSVGEFLMMFVQVIRVNKWKICPIVELENK